MFDRELVVGSLEDILSVCEKIKERTVGITCGDDFALSADGMVRLDAVCMNLIAIGEAVKGLDKITDGQLLCNYPQVYWKGVMRMRDKIAHYYFEVDADIVYNTISEDIKPLAETIRQIIKDLKAI